MNEEKVHPLISAITKLQFDKKKIIQVLFVTALVLLAVNFLAVKLFVKVKADSKNEISFDKVDKIFKTSLSQLGIEERFIKLKRKKSVDTPADYSIIVPDDLSVALILIEIKNNFSLESIDLSFNEKVIGGKTVIKISQGEDILLSAELNYDKNLKRTGGYIAFILEGFNELDEQSISALLKAPELFGIFLIPSKNNLKFADSISNYRKEVVVLLNDDISELDYKLSDGYSRKRLNGSINSIVSGFKKSVCFVIDENSDLNNSSVGPLLTKEFAARKILYLKKRLVTTPEGSSIDEKIKSFREILDDAKNNLSKAVLIEAEQFLSFMPEIIKYRKIGYKFVNPSEVLPYLAE